MKHRAGWFPASLAIAAISQCLWLAPARAANGPDTVFVNGKVLTLDAAGTVAQALAVKDGRIERVGTTRQITALASRQTQVVDLHGRTVVPGFVDGHAHPTLAVRMIQKYVDGRFATTPSVATLLARIKDRAAQAPPGEWIIVAGSSSSQTRFAEHRLPTRAELDSVSGNHPLMFLNGSHEAVVNSEGLRVIGITRGTSEMKGAHIELDATGEPTGVIKEGMGIFPDARIPEADLRAYFLHDIPAMWNAHGYTSVYAITPLPELAVLRQVAAEHGPATLRYAVAIFTDPGGRLLPAAFDAMAFPAGVDPEWYRFAGIKVWVDSDVPMKGGALTAPYAGPDGGLGILNVDQAQLDALALRAERAGVPFLAHATGDRATAMALTAFERAQQDPAARGSLQRIEHFGEFVTGPDDLARAKRLGVKVNVQPAWLYTLGNSTIQNLGPERARTGFEFRSMVDAGLEPGAGTDLTGIVLETLNPFLHIWAAVTRNSDVGVFEPAQAVTVDQALRMMTIWSARAQGEGAIKGSLEPGKVADLVVLSDDITEVEPAAIRDLKVLETVVGGRVVYESHGPTQGGSAAKR
ncbi:MAG: amidohydrolase [Gammaproteobacteria bacterium]|nr:amidohydrolase [Gammaproteobacteria bacterium]